jgi:hypothetical protein
VLRDQDYRTPQEAVRDRGMVISREVLKKAGKETSLHFIHQETYMKSPGAEPRALQ